MQRRTFYQAVDIKITGRLQRVEVNADGEIRLSGCDGCMTPVQAAAARTLLDEALAHVASLDGGAPYPERKQE
jgi:hypothetical protein